MRGRSASNAAHNSCLGAAPFLRDRLQREEHGTVGEIGPRHDVLDAVQDHRPGGVEQYLVLVGVKLAHREAAAGGQPTERVGNPGGQARHVVEGEHMAVARGDEQVAVLAWQRPQWRGVRIEQRPQDRRKGRLRRALFARQRDHRIGAAIAQAGQRPGDHQHEVGVGLHVEERSQRFDRSAARGDRQRLHARGAAEPDRRIVDYPPALSVDLNRPPVLVAEVEIEFSVEPTHTNINDAFRRVEMRLRLNDVECRLQRFRTRRALCRLEETAREPAAEALGADRPGLAMAVDVEVGEAGPIRRVE